MFFNKNVQITVQFHSFHMLVRLGSKSFRLAFNSLWTENFHTFKLDLEKAQGTRDQITNICWIIEKAREFQKTSTSASLTTLKFSTLCITVNCGKFFKRWKYKTTLPASWEICSQVKKQQLEPDMYQWTCSKLGKEYVKAGYCHPAYLTHMQSTSCEVSGWMNHKLELKLQGEIAITSDMQMISL